jgi:hypothetical protein
VAIDERGESLYWVGQNFNTSEFELHKVPLIQEGSGFGINPDTELTPQTWLIGNQTYVYGLVYESPFIYYIGNDTTLVQLDPRTNQTFSLFSGINSTRGVNPIQTVSEKLILLNDAVSGLTLLRLNGTGDGSNWLVSQAPEYLSLPLTSGERVNAFSTLVYSQAAQMVARGLLSVMMMMSNFLF